MLCRTCLGFDCEAALFMAICSSVRQLTPVSEEVTLTKASKTIKGIPAGKAQLLSSLLAKSNRSPTLHSSRLLTGVG